MKKILIFLLLILSMAVFSAEYDFEYKSLPKKISYSFKFDIYSETEKGQISRFNTIDIMATDEKDKYKSVVNSRIAGNINQRNLDFNFLNTKKALGISFFGNEHLYPGVEFPPDMLSAQLSFPKRKLKVGDTWRNKVKNPLAEKDLYLDCRLVRVADNIATISFNVRNSLNGRNIRTEKELMEQKIRDGSTFYFVIDDLSGHAEISGSGIWIFDIEKGILLSSDQYYKITSLMRRDDKAYIESIKDFIYVDVLLDGSYKFEY